MKCREILERKPNASQPKHPVAEDRTDKASAVRREKSVVVEKTAVDGKK